MGGAVAIIGEVVSALSGAFGIGEQLFGHHHAISIPTIKPFTIPQGDLEAINNQIAKNTQLSDTARQAAQQSIDLYNKGQLSGAYAGEYQRQLQQRKNELMAMLAGQGFTPQSTQYQTQMQNLALWAANLKSQMLQQQLRSGLAMAGLSNNAINNYLTKWKAESAAKMGAAETAANAMNTNLAKQQYEANQGSAISSLAQSIPKEAQNLANLYNTLKPVHGHTISAEQEIKANPSITLLSDFNPNKSAKAPSASGFNLADLNLE